MWPVRTVCIKLLVHTSLVTKLCNVVVLVLNRRCSSVPCEWLCYWRCGFSEHRYWWLLTVWKGKQNLLVVNVTEPCYYSELCKYFSSAFCLSSHLFSFQCGSVLSWIIVMNQESLRRAQVLYHRFLLFTTYVLRCLAGLEHFMVVGKILFARFWLYSDNLFQASERMAHIISYLYLYSE